jgi:hypothetical protein
MGNSDTVAHQIADLDASGSPARAQRFHGKLSRRAREKSELEHDLTVVLPFGGRHPDAVANVSAMVPGRLRKNARLHKELAAGFEQSGGRALPNYY